MSKLFDRFWKDDEGAIISVEMILILSILIFGIIPGLVALRNGVIAAFVNIANALSGVIINVAVDGIGVSDGPSPDTDGIAGVGGFYIISSYPTDQLVTSGVLPTTLYTYNAAQLSPDVEIPFPSP